LYRRLFHDPGEISDAVFEESSADWENSRRPVTAWFASATDGDLLEPRPSHLGGSRTAGEVMTVLVDEQIHHGAEIALLRDLCLRLASG